MQGNRDQILVVDPAIEAASLDPHLPRRSPV
jgi:hypothetical protein